MIDFETFHKSRFFRKGQLALSLDSNEQHDIFSTSEAAFYVELEEFPVLSEVSNYKHNNYAIKLGISLFASLDCSVPIEVRNLIINQWILVNQLGKTLGFKPLARNLIIQPPKTKHAKHKHGQRTNTTVIILFRYKMPGGDLNGRLISGENDQYFYEYKQDVQALVVENNEPHYSQNENEWLFFWPTDYAEVFDSNFVKRIFDISVVDKHAY
ncbi:hypothetical protein H7Y21_00025 [Arenimonas sp.]|nr:hypothetical protein [Candidatus Parcubacteria bacterium]